MGKYFKNIKPFVYYDVLTHIYPTMRSTKMLLLITISLYGMISCSDSSDEVIADETLNETLYFPPINSDVWETISIDQTGWNVEAEQPLYQFLEEKGTKAFIILKDGKIVVEHYFNGATITDNNPWYSAGKTLTAFTVGIAQQDNLLDINKASADYLGNGWSSMTADQENAVTVSNHLTMTTGLDYSIDNLNCTDVNCLTFLQEPNIFWYYHNAPYTLLTRIIENAVDQDFNTYFDSKIKNKIGMNGSWITLGYAEVYFSTARSMARFGLLNLNKGSWNTEKILTDMDFFDQMTNTSQSMNPSYGYLWWLNGKNSYRTPSLEIEFQGELIPNAPNDLIAGLGKNDQKLYIIPSKNMVIVRMGDDAGETLLGPSSFDNELWAKINTLIN